MPGPVPQCVENLCAPIIRFWATNPIEPFDCVTMGAEASKPGVVQAFAKLSKDVVPANDTAFWKWAPR